MCVWQCSFFRITDKLLQFDLSILILDKLCMNLLCLYRYFLLVLINCIYFSNVTSTYYMEMK